MADSQTIRLHNRIHRRLQQHPVTYGVPWSAGEFREGDTLSARDENGEAIPCAWTPLNTWPDGSIQWALLDLSLDFEPSADRAVTLNISDLPPPTPAHPCHVENAGTVLHAGNGLVQVALGNERGNLVPEWTTGSSSLIAPRSMDITFRDAEGHMFFAALGERRLTVEHYNTMRTVIRADGTHATEDGRVCLDYYLRFEIRANRDDVKITYGFRNREEPVPGIEISDYAITMRTTLPESSRRCFTASRRTRFYRTQAMRVDEDLEVVASDTGDIDRYVDSHTDGKRGEAFIRHTDVLQDPEEEKPWFLQRPQFRLLAGGQRCVWPYVGLLAQDRGLVAAFSKMVALHPKCLRVQGSELTFGLWPDWAGPLRITQGAGRSHTVHVASLSADATDLDIQNRYLGWEMGGLSTASAPPDTVTISPDLDQVRESGVFGIDKLPSYEPDTHYRFERKVRDAWLGITYGQLGAVDQVARPEAIGFWDYGDTGGNNEEMHARVFFENYLRTGDWACAEVGLAFAHHIMEVDHVAYSIEPLQNGGMVSHCVHHNDGAAYPSHMWFTELLFAFALTGDIEFKRAAMRMCESLLNWIDDEDGFRCVTADQREAGQPMINLTACYQFNRDSRYLQGCRKIIRQGLMAKAEAYGRMLDAKPPDMPVKLCIYGDYASYEGMFAFWEITRDAETRTFMLSQLEWRLTLPFMHAHGFHRVTDYNPAAYAYYMTGDRSWMDRAAKPFRAAFSAARWPLGWIHSMACIKLAFDLGLVKDDDITVQ